jgi:hypothetical protein
MVQGVPFVARWGMVLVSINQSTCTSALSAHFSRAKLLLPMFSD